MSSISYLTVKALTKYIKRKFDADPHLRDVYVKGELSNVKIHTNGHIYFSLKDEASIIKSTMFKTNARNLAFRPEDGMQVFIRGDVNVYEGGGVYQLYAQSMEPDGIGGLFVAFNQLKEKLEKEGLFRADYKQPIAQFPERIGVLTATTGAAIRDVVTTIQRRYPLAEICIYPTLVQGANAAANIVKNIRQANQEAVCDVLIVGRGGGSIEDLWAFNEEIVARAIFESRIPIISAVGHETDTTIADFVADLRAPTPTAAAEMAVPNRPDLIQQLLVVQSRLQQMTTSRIQYEKTRLSKLVNAYPLATPERLYRPFTERLVQADIQLQKSMDYYMKQKENDIALLASRLESRSPQQQITYTKRQIQNFEQQLIRTMQHELQQHRLRFDSTLRTLEALNPLSLMAKGFSVVYSEDNVVKSVEQLTTNDEVTIQMHDGFVEAKILSTKKGDL